MRDFDTILEQFRNKELNVEDWHWCISRKGYWRDGKWNCPEHKSYAAYIMGEGAEQCLASRHGYETRQEIVELYKSLGVNEKRIFPI